MQQITDYLVAKEARVAGSCRGQIAISGLAASLSTASALVAHDIPGRVILLGTPAEEFEGGKLKLLDAGAYKDMDACL